MRWFVKGKNEVVELFYNQDWSFNLSLMESESNFNF